MRLQREEDGDVLTEICGYLKNWFNRRPDGRDYPKYHGEFTISQGVIRFKDGDILPMQEGQYYRILGSVFNNGVFCFSASPASETAQDTPRDETFEGEVWSMAVPPDVIALDKLITDWMAENSRADSPALSPYASESFGGYSYSKGGGNSSVGGTGVSWVDVFGSRLVRYKKL